ncbi:MAG: hypothetical protein AAFR66_10635 [Bacteroidota bacterium]
MTFIQKIVCSLLISYCCLLSLEAQSFEKKGINYQAVISQSGSILANEKILFRFTVLQEGGIPTYQGEQSLITDDKGRVATVIGTGQSVFSGFSQVDWTDPDLKLQVEVDPDQSGYREISNEPIQSVPFSFMANEVINLPERNLNSLSNVETSDIITGQVLQWNGQNWTAGNATSPWSEVDEGKIAYTGKIGLNKANPIFDIDSEGFFQHEGFFQVSTNSFPAMRIRSQQSGNVVPKAVLQFTLGGVNGQATVDHSPGSLNFTVIDDELQSTGVYIIDSGLIGIDDETPSEKLDVAGAIKIGNTNRTNNGTIRWTGSDFEGRKGGNWVSLTAQPQSNSLVPIAYGSFDGKGKVNSERSTNNFTVKRLDDGEYQLELNSYPIGPNYLLMVNPGSNEAFIIIQTQIVESGGPNAQFDIATYALSGGSLKDAEVNFVIYQP